MLSSSLQKIRNRISTPIGHRLLESRDDDVFIAAFPRSGSTWLRTILVNIIEPSAESDPDIFNATIPAVSIRNAKIINALASPRRIMTHSLWRPSMRKAVYLVRDGRDAFISSYHYHVTRNNAEISLRQYYDLYRAEVYGRTWSQHTNSWLNDGLRVLQDNLLLIRFEDLKGDAVSTLRSVCSFMQIEASDAELKKAIATASIENAREIERSRQGLIADKNASFYREGNTRQWQRPEYQSVIKQFMAESQAALNLAGYLQAE